MAIPREIVDKLFQMDEAIQNAGFRGGLTPEEIRVYHAKMLQGKSPTGLAPMPRQNMIPQAGFQGNFMFPNQGGGGSLMPGQVPPPMSAPVLNPGGQMMPQQMNPSLQGQQNMLAQNSPQGGFDTHIHLGADGQVNQINLKRAIQKARMQRGLV